MRFSLLVAALVLPALALADTPDVLELSATDARVRLAAGTLSARALTEASLARVAAIDSAGPQLRAVIEIAPDALAVADRLDAEREAGRLRGPLHGLPVLIKDNIDVCGMVNSAGSLALAENRPARDAFLVARLREAGAVVLGKTNLSEWANFRSEHSSSGWSSRGGQTRNPYVLDRSPCGSSSGTGAAIAASLAPLGVGTETDGSILCPSAVNGLVGLKPTVGLVSRDGIIPISATQDTAGPMTRSVADAALLLQVLAAVDPADAAAGGRPAASVDYLAALAPDALRGRRIGVIRQSMGQHPGIDAAAEAAYASLRAAGATLVDVQIPTWGQWGDAEYTLMLVEFRQGLEAYLRRADSPFGELAALADWNRANAARVMPWFGQEIFDKALALDPHDEAAYRNARATAQRLAWEEGLRPLFEEQGFDALVGPTNGPAWSIDVALGDPPGSSAYGIAAVAGTPSITVPMGALGELPLGLAFLGKPWGEAALLAMAADFEQRTRARRAPHFLPTIDPDRMLPERAK